MNFLCDTNILSEAMKRVPYPHVRLWLDEQHPIIVSAITVEEIYFGLSYKDAKCQLAWFENFIQTRCQVLPITPAIAKQSGIWRGQFRKRGINRAQADFLIAATALVHNLTLATRHTRDFEECEILLFNPFNPSLKI